MSTQKSFLDNFSLDSSWISGNQLSIQSPGNSQNDTLFESHSQASRYAESPSLQRHRFVVPQSDESRKLHQDHKSIKRAVDRTAQESAVAFSSLHEKTSKLNLSISDLHSDLKKLERSVMIENDSLRTSSVDMEIKLNNIVSGIETKLVSCLSDRISTLIDTKVSNLVNRLESRVLKHISAEAKAQIIQCSGGSRIEELRADVADIKRATGELSTALESIKSSASANSLVAVEPKDASTYKGIYGFSSAQALANQVASAPMDISSAGTNQLIIPPLPLLNQCDMLQPMSMGSLVPPTSQMSAFEKSEGIASTLCITTWSSVFENRTSCGPAFSISEAIKCVDDQYPFVLVDGWPVAEPSSVTSSTTSAVKKRQRTQK